ncbi:terminase small subunit [Chitinophaga niabensis]|uniref:terminase small subunit n=1 Tax=Chitinophaga niabensis TaxID=536979 RepID=UPI0031BAFF57
MPAEETFNQVALKPEHKNFIKHYVKTGDHIGAYQKAFPHSDRKSAATNGGRLLKNEEIAEAIRREASKISKKAEEKATNELKDEIKGEVLTAIEKRDLLRRIAKGELVNGKKATIAEMIKAIEVDNKMGGDNAPDKLDHTTKGKALPVTTVQTIRVIHSNPEHGNPDANDTDDAITDAGDGVDGDQ